jgi:hypothetical protein
MLNLTKFCRSNNGKSQYKITQKIGFADNCPEKDKIASLSEAHQEMSGFRTPNLHLNFFM